MDWRTRLFMLVLQGKQMKYQKFFPGKDRDRRSTAIKQCPKGLIPIPFIPAGQKKPIGVAYYSVG